MRRALVAAAAAGIAAFQAAYQSQIPFSLTAANPNYLGTLLSSGVNLPIGLFAPDYKTPRSLQMNAGFQRELRPGTVLTMDYLRNITTHLLLGIDQNHVGDIRYFNKSAAQGAIAATLSSNGWSSIQDAINHGATITDFAMNGLGSPNLDFGGSCPFSYGCAFSGINAAAPEVPELEPIGRSVYNGLDVKLTQNVSHPLRGMKALNFQVAYSLSRFVEPGGASANTPGAFANNDQDFVNYAVDFDHPLAYEGPAALDRTQQLSFGGVADWPGGFRTSITAHFYSGLPLTLTVPNTGLGPGEIFRTDFTGDGSVGDLLPGTAVGEFGRGISASQLGGVIQNYNNTMAGQPTPAGQLLVSQGLFSVSQLQALGAVAPSISTPPPGQVGTAPLRDFDLRVSWVHRFGERFSIEPSCGIFNLFNFANFDLPPNIMSGLLNGAPGSVNNTTQAERVSNRVGLGTGVFALGAPRQVEFGMTISF